MTPPSRRHHRHTKNASIPILIYRHAFKHDGFASFFLKHTGRHYRHADSRFTISTPSIARSFQLHTTAFIAST